MKTIYCSFLCTSVVIKELFWDGNILLVALEALALNMLVTIAVVHIRNLKMVWCFFYVVMHAGLG
jgi:DMSO/TMAO reductase YedYZ heme-binding membrane subunit